MAEHFESLGKYKIKRVLGEGAMGVVYEGFDPDIERSVAIKTLKKELVTSAGGEEFLLRFKREAQAAAKCSHPNIVSVMEYGQEQDTPYMVMEYVEGHPLSDYLKKKGSLQLKLAIQIMSSMLKALNLAHSKGVIHRDIKPANIMILKGGTAKLADFGVARASSNSELTQVGMMIGTPKFMAPEQLIGEIADQQADLFSLAVVFMEVLKVVPKSSRISYGTLPEIPGLPDNNKLDHQQAIPLAFVGTLQQALAARKEDRFANAKDFFASLKNDLNNLNAEIGSSDKSISKSDQSSTENSTFTPNPSLDSDLSTVSSGGTISSQLNEQSGTQLSELDSLNSLTGYQTALDQNDFDEFGVNLDHQTKLELSESLSSFVGPIAGQLIESKLDTAITFSELVHGLANEISNPKQKKKFISIWSE